MSLALLSQQVIARIAAGEVIERPSSVVKELVENALDAGATQITVQVAGGGMETIHVADNGCGIAPDDLELAFERHATSKIAAFDDMFALSTLGFRGEALPSIVAVADVEITSCQDGAIGSKLEFRGGVVHKKSLHGRSQGTSISASHLFQSVPARLKFLKSRSSEESRIAQVLCQYALAYPEVKFSLICDGKEKLSTNGHGVLADVVLQIYGTEVARHLLSLEPFVSDEASSIRISGLVASPAVSRSNNSYISLFINRRWVTSRRLIYAVEEAYHGLLMTGRHPIAVINIVIAPDQVDVNIHPTKSEVKMSDESAVFGMVQRSVRQTLLQTAPVVSVTPSPAQSPTQIVSQADFLPKGAFGTVRNPVSVWPHDASLADEPYSALRATPRDALPALRLLGQVRNKYIVAEGPDGVYLIDQHAAHERILFERLRKEEKLGQVSVQALLTPEPLELAPAPAALLAQHLDALAHYGFLLEEFGVGSYIVRTVPAVLLDNNKWKGMLLELSDSGIKGRELFLERIHALTACHGAIRFGQSLREEEMRELLRQLEQTVTPNTCPHGRPTLICLSFSDLAKGFKRT